MANTRPFEKTQRAFIGAIRDPENHPVPGDIEDRRMDIYRELFYNNVEDFLASTFPVLKEISGNEAWHALIRDYFARHRAKTPLFMQMPREFIDYLQNEREPQQGDFPFMLELAHYEWSELALATTDDCIEMDGIDANGDLLDGIPVVSPLAWVLSYQYAVHKIGPDYLPTANQQQPSHLIVFRNRKDDVEFIETNPVTARLLLLLQQESGSARAVLNNIAFEIGHSHPETIVQHGLSTLSDLHHRGVILGSRIQNPC